MLNSPFNVVTIIETNNVFDNIIIKKFSNILMSSEKKFDF